jgi:hypothetical protein
MSESQNLASQPLIPTLAGLAEANHASLLLILAALRNPQVWEVVGGGLAGPGGPAALSEEGKKYLGNRLEETFNAVLQKGNVSAAVFATHVAMCRAKLLQDPIPPRAK